MRSRKRVFESVSDADHSQYGVTSGWMLENNTANFDCGCISSGWPIWAFSLASRGWRVKCILAKDTVWIGCLKNWFEGVENISLGSSFRLSDMYSKIRFWFSDIDIPRSLRLWESEVNLLVTTHRARHVSDPSWKNDSQGSLSRGSGRMH
jgi:hypothetical protein